jgi:hypothetical protein
LENGTAPALSLSGVRDKLLQKRGRNVESEAGGKRMSPIDWNALCEGTVYDEKSRE